MSFHTDYEAWARMADPHYCPVCQDEPMPSEMVDIIELPHSWLVAEPVDCLRCACHVIAKKHVIELFELSESELLGLMKEVQVYALALSTVSGAVKINYEIHGNSAPHLHIHLYPRYMDDPFPGQAIDYHRKLNQYAPGAFAAYVAEMRRAIATFCPGEGQVTLTHIHMARIGKSTRHFHHTLVREDDGTRIDTQNSVGLEAGRSWSKEWWGNGLLPAGQVIRMVRKHHFYNEWFGIMELCDEEGRALAWYCDVVTPLQRVDGEYYLTDLLLDLLIWPDGSWRELDWEEFRAAQEAGLITVEMARQAEETLRWMVEETRAGKFPKKYL